MTGTWMWRWRYSGSASMSWIEVRRKDGKTEGRKVKLLSVLVLSVFPPFPPSLLSAPLGPAPTQIHVPHSYYYREMYLPQATSGPSAAAWSPDGEELVYSMQGTLWRQRLGAPGGGPLTR